jgi:hypothetical protein
VRKRAIAEISVTEAIKRQWPFSFRSNDLDTVGEPYRKDDLQQLVVIVAATPALGGLRELEDHGQRSLVRETSLRTRTMR